MSVRYYVIVSPSKRLVVQSSPLPLDFGISFRTPEHAQYLADKMNADLTEGRACRSFGRERGVA